ncbi:hypothetical protein SAMN05443247_08770 [Bradyrhizobium erythrophlei]|nr:hypothetical protein SAMN05443247_08770 [Bradyrhizobium erythrophlei]
MSAENYVPPKVWSFEKANGGTFAGINKPTAGATHGKELAKGRHPMQLYSQGTWNGIKVTVMLEDGSGLRTPIRRSRRRRTDCRKSCGPDRALAPQDREPHPKGLRRTARRPGR